MSSPDNSKGKLFPAFSPLSQASVIILEILSLAHSSYRAQRSRILLLRVLTVRIIYIDIRLFCKCVKPFLVVVVPIVSFLVHLAYISLVVHHIFMRANLLKWKCRSLTHIRLRSNSSQTIPETNLLLVWNKNILSKHPFRMKLIGLILCALLSSCNLGCISMPLVRFNEFQKPGPRVPDWSR
jgi:hypothetical protein